MSAFKKLLLISILLFSFNSFCFAQAPVEALQETALYPLRIGSNFGYVNKSGNVVIEPKFNAAFFFEGRLAKVNINQQWGAINKVGRFVIEPQYDAIGRFSEGLVSVRKNKKIGFVNETGKVIVALQGDDLTMPEYKNGVAAFYVKDNSLQNKDKYYYVDTNGKYITKDQFWKARQYKNLNRCFPIQKGGKWSLVNEKREVIIETQYDKINEEKDGLFLVVKNNKYGFIDKRGNIVINLQFEDASDFKGNLASVKMNGKYGLIDKAGKFIIQPRYDWISANEEGVFPVSVNKKYGLIDRTGRYILEPQIEIGPLRYVPVSFEHGIGRFQKDGKWGLIDRTGKILIEPKFDNPPSFFNGLGTIEFAIVKNNFKQGVVDKSGKIIIPQEYTQITVYSNYAHPDAPNVFHLSKHPYNGYADTSGTIFVMTDTECGHDVVRNSKREITWPRNIKSTCGR